MSKIGIRREDKNVWERRVPVIPDHVRELARNYGIEFVVQPSDIRVFKDNEYQAAGAKVAEEISSCSVIMAVKEIPERLLEEGKVYIFFSHTIKGQKHNMPLLKKIMELNCTLIDFEKIEDDNRQRLIFFGRHAGLAGMVDSLWAFGQRLKDEGLATFFDRIKPAHEYRSLDEIKDAVQGVGDGIVSAGLPAAITPVICGFAGYGNVSNGAQEIFDILPVKEITPAELLNLSGDSSNVVYKAVFKEEDMVEPSDPQSGFELQDYYKHPERYRSVFEKFVPRLSILMNCIYWDTPYPRLVTRKLLKDIYGGDIEPRLKVIGDISCDVNGAVEATIKCTDPGDPVYVYDVTKNDAVMGVRGRGPVILAVDNLPCEISRESSTDFSLALERFIPAIAEADYSAAFDMLALPQEIKRAVIVHQGKLTPDYEYLKEVL